MLLEAAQYESNAFITLTLADDHLSFVKTSSLCSQESLVATLVPKDVSDWLKRFRKAIAPVKVRYFLVGEYGDETWRPHYHVALFNYPTCERGRTLREPGRSRAMWARCCNRCHLVGKTWGLGDVDLGTLEAFSAQYVCGYVAKKLTSADDHRLLGRYPEFARSSKLGGGIGYAALHEIASEWMRLGLDKTMADVPSAIRIGPRIMPLGNYMRRQLRLMVGMDEKAPAETVAEAEKEVRDVFNRFDLAKTPGDVRKTIIKNALIDDGEGEAQRLLARAKIFRQRRSL